MGPRLKDPRSESRSQGSQGPEFLASYSMKSRPKCPSPIALVAALDRRICAGKDIDFVCYWGEAGTKSCGGLWTQTVPKPRDIPRGGES